MSIVILTKKPIQSLIIVVTNFLFIYRSVVERFNEDQETKY